MFANMGITIGKAANRSGQLLVPANATTGAYAVVTTRAQPHSFYAFWPPVPGTVT